jgi:aminobenzoyl-glutamate utilization protein B
LCNIELWKNTYIFERKRIYMLKNKVVEIIDSHEAELTFIARKIWEKPEAGYSEVFASQLQRQFLEEKGFTIKSIEGLDTAFIAEYGSGEPVIGFLGEYDALEGQSQKVSAQKEPVAEGEAGHGCGHNLLGAGSLGAALALKELMEAEGSKGTVRYYGCPAEELLSGKVRMAAAGAFSDLTCAFSWHPFDINAPFYAGANAVANVNFRFRGTASHAAQSPQNGRSALDAVELMNVGVNYLREHVIDSVRIHYVITNGGERPNIVPANAASWYTVRGPKASDMKSTLERIVKIAKGASMMTETEMEYEVVSAAYDYLPNRTLTSVIEENMKLVGAPKYSREDYDFAEKISSTMTREQREAVLAGFGASKSLSSKLLHDELGGVNMHNMTVGGSFDMGDVSYVIPCAQLAAAAWPLGTPAHTWQACAASGHGMGYKAAMMASKVLAMAACDVINDSSLAEKAWEEFRTETKGQTYKGIL